jgi:hypothetical protein
MANSRQRPPLNQVPIDDAAYWLSRAAEVETIAEGMTYEDTRGQMLRIAKSYKLIAEHAYRRAKETPRRS